MTITNIKRLSMNCFFLHVWNRIYHILCYESNVLFCNLRIVSYDISNTAYYYILSSSNVPYESAALAFHKYCTRQFNCVVTAENYAYLCQSNGPYEGSWFIWDKWSKTNLSRLCIYICCLIWKYIKLLRHMYCLNKIKTMTPHNFR